MLLLMARARRPLSLTKVCFCSYMLRVFLSIPDLGLELNHVSAPLHTDTRNYSHSLRPDPDAAMDVDASTKATVSTHGPRNSRREQWRASKGWEPRPTAKGMNKQGGIAAKRRPGRAKRRR
jgi:hypothetical protein